MKLIRADEMDYEPAGHESPTAPGVWKKVLLKREEMQQGTVQMVNWAKLPAGNSFAAHYHEDMQEFFVILSGTPRITVSDEAVQLRPGDTILIDAREVHEMRNDGDEDVEYLAVGITASTGGKTVVV